MTKRILTTEQIREGIGGIYNTYTLEDFDLWLAKHDQELSASLKRDAEIESRIAFDRLTRINKAEELLRLVPMMTSGSLPADFETLIKEFLES